MIHGLDPALYPQARPLFHSLEAFQPMCAAVLEGIHPGTTYTLSLDEVESVVQEAHAHLQAGHYEEAIAAYERFFSLHDDPPARAYYETAQAWAALDNLNTGVDRGWSSAAALEGCQEFECLRGMPKWTALLDRIRQG